MSDLIILFGQAALWGVAAAFLAGVVVFVLWLVRSANAEDEWEVEEITFDLRRWLYRCIAGGIISMLLFVGSCSVLASIDKDEEKPSATNKEKKEAIIPAKYQGAYYPESCEFRASRFAQTGFNATVYVDEDKVRFPNNLFYYARSVVAESPKRVTLRVAPRLADVSAFAIHSEPDKNFSITHVAVGEKALIDGDAYERFT